MAFTLDIVLLSSFNSSQFLVYQTLRAFLSLLSLSMFPYLEALSHIYAGRANKSLNSDVFKAQGIALTWQHTICPKQSASGHLGTS
jgi:hypothetical protein